MATDVTQAMVEFALVAGAMTLVPGLDFAFVLRAGLTQTRRVAFAAGLGIATGLMMWAFAAAVGLSALLTASTWAFQALQLIGAAYMLYLGFTYLRGTPKPVELNDTSATAESASGIFVRGLLSNLLNPKIGIFYLAILPPFLPTDVPAVPAALALASVHVVECLVYFGIIISAAHAFKTTFLKSTWRRWIDRASGALIIGFGIRLLNEAAA